MLACAELKPIESANQNIRPSSKSHANNVTPIVKGEAHKKVASEKIIQLTPKSNRSPSQRDTENPQALNSANLELQHALNTIRRLEAQLHFASKSSPIKWLEMHEHRPLLERSLQLTQNRLMIISPWIRASAVNTWFLEQFETLLKKGIKVYIGYGLGEKDEKQYKDDLQAEQELRKLSKKYPQNFTFQWLGDTHAKILISDTKFAVTTSFNWLSFRGEKNREFRDERGTLVADSQKVDELFHSLLSRFKNP
jgi:phosphatidylserine/phosphatidylglycerophosphate/cardiolipin synthase-like enzyme